MLNYLAFLFLGSVVLVIYAQWIDRSVIHLLLGIFMSVVGYGVPWIVARVTTRTVRKYVLLFLSFFCTLSFASGILMVLTEPRNPEVAVEACFLAGLALWVLHEQRMQIIQKNEPTRQP